MRIFWKTSLFFRRYSHIFVMENQLPGFSIIRRYGWSFLMKMYFLKVHINVSINDYSFIYICVVSMLFKSLFLLSNLLCNVDFADWVSKKTNIEIIGFWLCIEFALDSWNIALWDIDLLDTDLDFLVGHGQVQISPVNIFFSSRHVFKTSSRPLHRKNFPSSRTYSEMFSRCLQNVFKTYLQDIFEKSSGRLPDVLIDEKLLR